MATDRNRLAGYRAQQAPIPVGSRVAWTFPLFHVDHTGHATRTGTVVEHRDFNGMTTVKPSDGRENFSVVSVVLQPTTKRKGN